MDTVTAICGRLLEEGADRNSLVLAIWKYRWMLPSDPANPALTLAAYKAFLYFCKNKQPYAKDAKDR